MNLARCSKLQQHALSGTWYRAIQPQFYSTALQTSHTKQINSRYNTGLPGKPKHEILYLAEHPHVTIDEVMSGFGQPIPGGYQPAPKQPYSILPVQVFLQRVVDLTDEGQQHEISTSAQELTGDWKGYRQRKPDTSITGPIGDAPTQRLGEALFAVPNLEAFQTVSAKAAVCRNLVIFPEKLLKGSSFSFSHPATKQHHIVAGRRRLT